MSIALIYLDIALLTMIFIAALVVWKLDTFTSSTSAIIGVILIASALWPIFWIETILLAIEQRQV